MANLVENELKARWPLVAGAACGLTAGMTATMFYSLGAFIPALQAEFGWGRGDISLAVTLMTVAVFITGVPAGQLADRYGAARVGAGSLLLYATALVVAALTISRIEHLWLAYTIIAVLGVASTPIVMIRPITAAFDARRGLAMGIALTGAGVAGFWVPILTTSLIESAGWRAAYVGLAMVAVVAAPIVWFTFRHVGRSSRGSETSTRGLTFLQAFRTKQFWLLTLMALAMASGIAGLVVHLVPMFRDFGAAPAKAAALASVIGITSVIGRLAIGAVLDRYSPPRVALTVLTLAAAGTLMLLTSGMAMALIAVMLLGLAAGAEVDLLSYLTSRYFGARSYGAIYGWQYSVFALGYGISPFAVGHMRDAFGNYDLALLVSAMLVAASGAISFGLGELPRRHFPA